jgi:hypothetical protein
VAAMPQAVMFAGDVEVADVISVLLGNLVRIKGELFERVGIGATRALRITATPLGYGCTHFLWRINAKRRMHFRHHCSRVINYTVVVPATPVTSADLPVMSVGVGI